MTETTTFKQLAVADVLAERYSVSKLVASNEYANVYKAFDIVNDGAPVAIKTINGKAGSDGVALELFNREVDSLSRLRHERIVRLLDFGNSPSFGQWLALEWMDGGSLQDAVMRQRLATAEGQIATLRALLEALAFAHLNHILHRDIKPANILYTRDGIAKLADFNVSKIIRRASAARTVKHIYTAEYASPEQLDGRPVTERSDVFSLGKVIAELVTAGTANPNELGLLQRLDATACPGPLKRELKKMLAPIPTDRPTAAEALREIEALIRSQRPMPAVVIRVADKVFQAMTLRAGKPQTPHEQRQALEKDLAGPLVCKLRTKESPKGGTTYTLIGRHYTYFVVATENDLGALSGLLITSVAELDAAWEDRNRAGAVELPLTMRSVAMEGFADFAGDAHTFVECHRHACAERDGSTHEARESRTQVKTWREYIGIVQEMRQRDAVLGHVRSSRERPEDELVEIRLERPAPLGAILEEARVQLQLPSGGRPESLGVIVEASESTLIVRADDDASVLMPLTVGSRIVLDNRQEAASLGRQIAALNALEDRADVCGDLADLVVFPERLKDAVPVKIVPRTANLDGSNRTVVEHALGTERIFLIQGPPGTGKTTVITELIAQILERERQSRVLLVSQANVAVDNVLERLDALLPATNAVRLGKPEKVASAVQHMLLESKLREEAEAVRVRAAHASELLDALPSRQDSLAALQELWTLAVGQTSDRVEVRRMATEVLGTAAGVADDDLPDRIAAARALADGTAEWHEARRELQERWRERLSRAGELETLLFANMRVVAGTCIGVISNRTIAEHKFDWVIVDEAARAAAPELLVPLIRGARIVLVGDHRQLPPILDREVIDEVFERGLASREQFERSLFETLFNGAPEGARARLTKQYRMHPTIAGLIERCFYPAGLGNGITADDRPLGIELWDAPLRWLDTSQLDAQERRVGTSYSNPEEVRVIVHDLKRVLAVAKAKNAPPIRIGVLSGYARQVDLLAEDIGRVKLPDTVHVDTMSVDAAQGKEYDLVYYSAVRANRNGRIGFLHDERRLNVALSRARHGLTIVGHRQSLREADTRFGPNPFLAISRYFAQTRDASVLTVEKP